VGMGNMRPVRLRPVHLG